MFPRADVAFGLMSRCVRRSLRSSSLSALGNPLASARVRAPLKVLKCHRATSRWILLTCPWNGSDEQALFGALGGCIGRTPAELFVAWPSEFPCEARHRVSRLMLHGLCRQWATEETISVPNTSRRLSDKFLPRILQSPVVRESRQPAPGALLNPLLTLGMGTSTFCSAARFCAHS